MKKFLALLLVFASLLTVGCGRGENTQSGFIDNRTGIEYYFASPMGLYPVSAGEEHLTVKGDNGETVYYKVQFEDPEKFLCYEEEGNLYLAYASTMKEPSVKEFNPIAASIYGSGNETYIASFYADNKYLDDDLKEHNPTEDTWLCQLIAEQISTGENVYVPVTFDTIEELYHIRLLSQDYPGLYYIVSFFGFEGRYYLRDGKDNKTVYCPREVILRMVGE